MNNKITLVRKVIEDVMGLKVLSIHSNIGKKSDMLEDTNIPGYINVYVIRIDKSEKEIEEYKNSEEFINTTTQVMNDLYAKNIEAMLYFLGFSDKKIASGSHSDHKAEKSSLKASSV